MASIQYNILFKKNGKPIPPEKISNLIKNDRYSKTVRFLIQNTTKLDEPTFSQNAAKLLNNFGMARSGPFKGVKLTEEGKIVGPLPRKNITACWDLTKTELKAVKQILKKSHCQPKARTLVLLDTSIRKEVIEILWQAFKKMLPVTMGENSYGLVGASKILFSVFPEIVLPLDNAEWLHVFQTVDLGDVINWMTEEIITWEKVTGSQLQNCDKEEPQFTLPAVYNVMAMEARP